MRARAALPRERHALRPAIKDGGPEGKLRGRPPPPHCRAPDLGDGRGLNPSPDEREPAAAQYYALRRPKTTLLKVRKIGPPFSAAQSGSEPANAGGQRPCWQAGCIL